MQVSTNGISSSIWSDDGKLTFLPCKGNLCIAKDVMNNHYDNSVEVESMCDTLYSDCVLNSSDDNNKDGDNNNSVGHIAGYFTEI